MRDGTAVPTAPVPIRLLMRPLPLGPPGLLLRRVMDGVRSRHPALFARLDVHATKTFLIDPTDLPFVFRLEPNPDRPGLELRRREEAGRWDARIAGPFAALVGMLHGAFDGDALFFSRDIGIEGDIEAVLALRNSLDDAQIDLVVETAAAFGFAEGAIERVARIVLLVVSRLTSLALTRVDRS